ncbi:MAG: biopolymer transporter ExbD [Bryobacterales bacterium]|nr:biopolymer transporter ExbD [Bryobacteraceae bacterium]MDW8354012.1 biopolymer transporter ExbD [Bryobacterales bacterium]
MAFAANSGGPLTGRGRFRRTLSLSDINVVPLVDVVLVLLIIFMLTAHVMEFGLEVEVPRVRQVRDSAEELPVVTITRDGRLFLNEQPVNINELGAAVVRRFGPGKAVYLRADKATIYDPIAQVVSELAEAKIEVRLVTQPLDEAARRRR